MRPAFAICERGRCAHIIEVVSPFKSGGLWFSANWDGTKTVEQVLGGGNLVVH